MTKEIVIRNTIHRKKGNNLRMSTRSLHFMMLPALIILFIYNYLPMIGIVIAFQDFNVGLGIRAFWESDWVGLYHFRRLFSSPDFTRAIINTLSGIDPTLYESAIIDGAGSFKQTIYVTIPGMLPIIVLSLVLSLGNVLNAGFDQIFNLYSVPVYETGDIIDTLVYRVSMQGGQYDFGTAVGLFKSVISMLLISLSYWMADKFAGYEIF